MHEAEHSDAASKPQRPLSESILAFRLAAPRGLHAIEGGQASPVELKAVAVTGENLQPWLGDQAILVTGRADRSPSELYGHLGMAIHATNDQYEDWDAIVAFTRARLMKLTGASDAHSLVHSVTGLLLRYVDTFHFNSLADVSKVLRWPIDAITSMPIAESDSSVEFGSEDRSAVYFAKASRRLLYNGQRGPTAHVAIVAIDVQRTWSSAAATNRPPLDIETELETVHGLSKLLLWRAMSDDVRADSPLFDAKEKAEFESVSTLASAFEG